MSFSKKHLRDISNKEDFRRYRCEVFHDYAAYLKDMIRNNYDLSVKFIMWLKQYLTFIRNERTFNASYLPRFQRGQVVFINLGFRIGHELGGPHYGIVLDNDNRKKDGLITIVPMISKKLRHIEQGVKPWEYELPIPISQLIILKAAKCRFVNHMLHKREAEKESHEETSIRGDASENCYTPCFSVQAAP